MKKTISKSNFEKIMNEHCSHHSIDNVTVHIHEHKAPTDESIKLYDEMLDKAMNKIVDSFVCRDNLFSYSYCIYETPNSSCLSCTKLTIVFKASINGHVYTIKNSVPDLVVQDVKIVKENGIW